MRSSRQEQVGAIGISGVVRSFQRIHWGPMVNERHDLGIDLVVQARDDRGFDRGYLIGVQVKAGPSYFRRPSSESETAGWWYYERNWNHFDYWINHRLPILLVLHHLDTDTSYWVHVTAESVKSTGKGCKILVPAGQTVDEDHVDRLYSIACQDRLAPSFEGTAWAGPREDLPQAQRLRCALLAPRIVAPHPNAGYQSPIDALECIALLAQGRFRALELLARERLHALGPLDSLGDNWSWHFLAALWQWVKTDCPNHLKTVFEVADRSEEKAASGVLLTCALRQQQRHRESLEVLNSLVDGDDLAPIEHGWVLVQRARILVDLGYIAQARTDALQARQTFQSDNNDVTVSALLAATAWLLFSTRDQALPEAVDGDSVEHHDAQDEIEYFIDASDTTVSWWRSQVTSWGLADAESSHFKSWALQTWQPINGWTRHLFSAALNADMTGEHHDWRTLSALAARRRLMNALNSSDNVTEFEQGLQALRQSGDHHSFKSALRRIKLDGPLPSVITTVRQIPYISEWTHTTTDSNFEALAVAGEFLDESAATGHIRYLTGVIERPLEFDNRMRPSGILPFFALNAVATLLSVANDRSHDRVAALMCGLLSRGQIPTLYLDRILNQLDFDRVDSSIKERMWTWSRCESSAEAASVLRWLGARRYPDAKGELIRRASANDLDALEAFASLALLNITDAEFLAPRLEELTKQVVADADNGQSTYGGFDAAFCLTNLNFDFSGEARWEGVTELLCNPRVGWHHKRPLCWLIAEKSEQLPANVRSTLATNLSSIGTASTSFMYENRIGGMGTVMAITMGTLNTADAENEVLRLAYGSRQERQDAALLLGLNYCPNLQHLLASLMSNAQPDVRTAAARAIGRLIATNPNGTLYPLATRLADEDGTSLPLNLLIGLSQGDGPLSTIEMQILHSLQKHASAPIRRLARRQLDRDP